MHTYAYIHAYTHLHARARARTHTHTGEAEWGRAGAEVFSLVDECLVQGKADRGESLTARERMHAAQGRVRAIVALCAPGGRGPRAGTMSAQQGGTGGGGRGAGEGKRGAAVENGGSFLAGNVSVAAEAAVRLVEGIEAVGWGRETSVVALPTLAALLSSLPRAVVVREIVPMLTPMLETQAHECVCLCLPVSVCVHTRTYCPCADAHAP